jgi:post-segregation antitoxin (ccd killing protein)
MVTASDADGSANDQRARGLRWRLRRWHARGMRSAAARVYVTLACAHAAKLSSLNTAAAAESHIVRELRRMATLMRGLAGDLGLAPSARQRQPVPGASDHGDPVSRFFGPAR